jgi:hypothetical protein
MCSLSSQICLHPIHYTFIILCTYYSFITKSFMKIVAFIIYAVLTNGCATAVLINAMTSHSGVSSMASSTDVSSMASHTEVSATNVPDPTSTAQKDCGIVLKSIARGSCTQVQGLTSTDLDSRAGATSCPVNKATSWGTISASFGVPHQFEVFILIRIVTCLFVFV